MNRDLCLPFATVILVLLALTALQAQERDEVEIRTTRVAGSVSMLQGAGGNIGVSVGDDGILVIDDQYAPLSEKILKAIRVLGTGPIASWSTRTGTGTTPAATRRWPARVQRSWPTRTFENV